MTKRNIEVGTDSTYVIWVLFKIKFQHYQLSIRSKWRKLDFRNGLDVWVSHIFSECKTKELASAAIFSSEETRWCVVQHAFSHFIITDSVRMPFIGFGCFFFFFFGDHALFPY